MKFGISLSFIISISFFVFLVLFCIHRRRRNLTNLNGYSPTEFEMQDTSITPNSFEEELLNETIVARTINDNNLPQKKIYNTRSKTKKSEN